MLPAYADLADVILDRSWLSEPIYGAAYRGGANRIMRWQRRMLERVALGRGASVVLCRTPWRTCKENFQRRKAEGGEMLDDTKQLRAVYDGYAKLERELEPGPMFEYNYETTIADCLALALDGPRAPVENLGPGIGRWAPSKSVLLVGERPGGFGGRWHLPFVSLRADGCSAWLAEQLEEYDIPESALYWVNAYESVDVPLDPHFLTALQPKHVFALGEEARDWCVAHLRDHGVGREEWSPHFHPQYHKRFHSKKPYPLIKELKQCLAK